MSLKDAVLGVADELEEKIRKFCSGDVSVMDWEFECRCLVRELRAACKASEGTAPAAAPGILSALASPELQHRLAIEDAKKEFKTIKKDDGTLAEETAETMMECIGGPFDNTHLAAPGNGQPGMKCVLDGHVYRITPGRKLLFDGPETAKLKKEMESKIVVVDS